MQNYAGDSFCCISVSLYNVLILIALTMDKKCYNLNIKSLNWNPQKFCFFCKQQFPPISLDFQISFHVNVKLQVNCTLLFSHVLLHEKWILKNKFLLYARKQKKKSELLPAILSHCPKPTLWWVTSQSRILVRKLTVCHSVTPAVCQWGGPLLEIPLERFEPDLNFPVRSLVPPQKIKLYNKRDCCWGI